MLNIQSTPHLGQLIGVDPNRIHRACEYFSEDVKRFHINGRDVISAKGESRVLQERLLNRLFRPKLPPYPMSHGGVKGRSIKTNAQAHFGSKFILKFDIHRFFPSISRQRIARRFSELGCHYDVARRLTRLCTFDEHLALGLVTSPILAESILYKVDERLVNLASKFRLKYSRFVDDIIFSGCYCFHNSGVMERVTEILGKHGFRLSPKQPPSITNDSRFWYGQTEEASITGIRIKKNGNLDITNEYRDDVISIIKRHADFSNGRPIIGELLTRDKIEGKIYFAQWVNAGSASELWRMFRRIKWPEMSERIASSNRETDVIATIAAPF